MLAICGLIGIKKTSLYGNEIYWPPNHHIEGESSIRIVAINIVSVINVIWINKSLKPRFKFCFVHNFFVIFQTYLMIIKLSFNKTK